MLKFACFLIVIAAAMPAWSQVEPSRKRRRF